MSDSDVNLVVELSVVMIDGLWLRVVLSKLDYD